MSAQHSFNRAAASIPHIAIPYREPAVERLCYSLLLLIKLGLEVLIPHIRRRHDPVSQHHLLVLLLERIALEQVTQVSFTGLRKGSKKEPTPPSTLSHPSYENATYPILLPTHLLHRLSHHPPLPLLKRLLHTPLRLQQPRQVLLLHNRKVALQPHIPVRESRGSRLLACQRLPRRADLRPGFAVVPHVEELPVGGPAFVVGARDRFRGCGGVEGFFLFVRGLVAETGDERVAGLGVTDLLGSAGFGALGAWGFGGEFGLLLRCSVFPGGVVVVVVDSEVAFVVVGDLLAQFPRAFL